MGAGMCKVGIRLGRQEKHPSHSQEKGKPVTDTDLAAGKAHAVPYEPGSVKACEGIFSHKEHAFAV